MSPKPALASESVFADPQMAVREWLDTSHCILLADILALTLGYWLVVLSRFAAGLESQLWLYVKVFPVVFFCLITFRFQGLYPGILLHPAEEMRSVFYAVSKVFLLAIASSFFWRAGVGYELSRIVLVGSWVLSIGLVLGFRHLVRTRFSGQKWWGMPTVVLGAGPAVREVVEALRKEKLGLRVVGSVSHPAFDPVVIDVEFPELEAVRGVLHPGRGAYVVLAMPGMPDERLWTIVRDYCQGFRHILYLPDMRGLCSLGMSVREMHGQIGFEIRQHLLSRSAGVVKRGVDLLVSGVAIALLLPLLALLVVLIRLTSKGKAIFTQSRIGLDGETIQVYKFRTMVEDAEAALDGYLAEHPEEQVQWHLYKKLKNDPRITSVGKWMRRLSLDELPQLFNVLFGSMSLVGPRPMMLNQLGDYGDAASLYRRVRPGITGLWQVSGRNRTTFAERAAFDEYYVRNWSIWMDFYILIRTVKTVVTMDGAS